MSYSRWSTDINGVMSSHEETELYRRGFDYFEIQKIRHHRGCETSDWYIFHHASASGETLTQQKLCIWHITTEHTYFYDYLLVKNMVFHDDWKPLQCKEITQKAFMVSCLQQWLDEMEQEFGSQQRADQ